MWNAEERRVCQSTWEVGESCPEDGGQRVGVVGDGFAEPATCRCGAAECFEEVDCEPICQRDDAAEVATLTRAGFAADAVVELSDEFFYTFD